MNLIFDRKYPDSVDIEKVENLFVSAFPPEERPPFEMAIGWKKSKFFGIYDSKTFVGLADLVEYRDMVYLFFLAIEEDKRGCGYGSAMLREIKKRYPNKRLFLLAEELDESYPNYEERKHRFAFYERNGFVYKGTKIKEIGVDYQMLIHGGDVSKEEFVAVMTYLIGKAMAKKYYASV